SRSLSPPILRRLAVLYMDVPAASARGPPCAIHAMQLVPTTSACSLPAAPSAPEYHLNLHAGNPNGIALRSSIPLDWTCPEPHPRAGQDQPPRRLPVLMPTLSIGVHVSHAGAQAGLQHMG
ncbi:hypothetical protein QBC39DRAFT_349935, partial [Podospora conica]